MAATPASPVPRTPHHGTSVYSRDGKWIYFIPGPADGPVEAFEMPAAGGEAVQITHGGAFHPEESYGGTSPYYSKGPGRPGVWTMSLKGGPERQVLDSVADQNWTLSPRGIYYLEAPPDPRAPAKVNYYSFQTQKSTSLGTIDRAAVLDFAGISLSPDTRTSLLPSRRHYIRLDAHRKLPLIDPSARIANPVDFYKYIGGAAAEFLLPITVPNPAHAQFISREASDPVEETRAPSLARGAPANDHAEDGPHFGPARSGDTHLLPLRWRAHRDRL